MGSGSVPPKLLKSPWNTGTMKMIMAEKMSSMTDSTTAGYVMADLMVRLSWACFSMASASDRSTSSRFPPTSPAWSSVQ